MTMTRAQRNEPRHSLSAMKKSAMQTAQHFNTPVIVYRARNGFYMTSREIVYKARKGDKPVCRVFATGEWEEMKEFLPSAYEQKYTASRCPCGMSGCQSWHVSPVADVQGVSFTEEEAKAVVDFLNRRAL